MQTGHNEINKKFGFIFFYLTQNMSISVLTQMQDCMLEGVYNIVDEESMVPIGSRAASCDRKTLTSF